MAGWQLAAREGTVVVARGGDGDALLLAAVEPPSSSPKAPSAGSLGHEKLLASGANANGASMHAKETFPFFIRVVICERCMNFEFLTFLGRTQFWFKSATFV